MMRGLRTVGAVTLVLVALGTADLPLRAAAAPPPAIESCTAGDEPKPRSHKWWSSDEGRAEIGLTDVQSKRLEAIFQRFLPALKSNKDDVDKYQREVSKLLAEAREDEDVVLHAIDRLESAQSALSRTRTLMLYRMYKLLTPEQREKVNRYNERRSKEKESESSRSVRR